MYGSNKSYEAYDKGYLNYLTQLSAGGGFMDVGATKVSDICIKNLF
jgi:hypothetical protein